MDTFLWLLFAAVVWFGVLMLLWWLLGMNCPSSTTCPRCGGKGCRCCGGKGYTLDEPPTNEKKRYAEYQKALSKGFKKTG